MIEMNENEEPFTPEWIVELEEMALNDEERLQALMNLKKE